MPDIQMAQVLHSVLVLGLSALCLSGPAVFKALWERQEGTPKKKTSPGERTFHHALKPHPAGAGWPRLLLRVKVRCVLPLSSQRLF